ncbi:hypothetical protein Bca4012_031051 [Brassica carinata]
MLLSIRLRPSPPPPPHTRQHHHRTLVNTTTGHESGGGTGLMNEAQEIDRGGSSGGS